MRSHLATRLKTLEALRSVENSVVRALRGLKELEAPDLETARGPAGGTHRIEAMNHLRAALHELVLALDQHRHEAAALHETSSHDALSITAEDRASRAPTS